MIRNRPDSYARKERLRVGAMALALVIAAVLGATMGLVWDYSGASSLFDEDQAAEGAEDVSAAD